MSDTTAGMRRKIAGAGDLQSVVRTMKAVAASSIGQYEKSVSALADFNRAVELGLGACFRESGPAPLTPERKAPGAIGAVVFGSDQGLVGQFNDVVADFAIKTLSALPGKHEVWAVGERVHERLADAGLPLRGLFPVPNSVKAITPLVGQILLGAEAREQRGEVAELHLFHNCPKSGAVYEPVNQRLLPLDEEWRRKLAATSLADEKACPKSSGAALRPCGHSSVDIFSCRSSGRAPNRWRAKTPAAWQPCNAPTRISTNCWRTSIAHFIVCARMASTRSCSTLSPASKR